MKQFLYTLINIILYAASFGKYIWLEGRFKNGLYRNWSRVLAYKPKKYLTPSTEEELIQIIKKSEKIRVVGAGHSFNNGTVSDEVLVSLDRYSGIVWKDLAKKRVCFKGGTRVRDISEILWKKYNLALEALPSHDAQSIAGILATDVHGTGREYGFVNQSVLKIKLIDGRGEVFECSPGDDCFKAAIGGIGAIGIITEVVLQCVDAFHIEQISKKCNKSYIKDNLKYLLEENDHVSIYAFPFTDRCVLSTWNRTDKEESFMGDIREFLNISFEALLLSSLVSFLCFIKLLPRTIDLLFLFKPDTKLVLKSYKGFNRTIYHLHNEFESALDRKEGMETVEEIVKIYESLYQKKNIPFNFMEIRFTPSHNNSFISPGHGRESVFIDLICNQLNSYKAFYSEAENYLRTVDARPHLGKYCASFSKHDFERMYGDEFNKFKTLVEIHDPNKKFQNRFIVNKFY